jgi:methyl-accepting chemotaxis protein
VRFILFFCLLLPLILGSTLYFTFSNTLSLLKNQKLGIASLIEINALLINLTSIKADNLKEKDILIQDNLSKLAGMSNELERASSSTHKIFINTIEEGIANLQAQWKNTQDATFSIANVKGLLKGISTLSNELTTHASLYMQIDSDMHSLLDSLSEALIPSQIILASFALEEPPEAQTIHSPLKSSLLTDIIKLESNLKNINILFVDTLDDQEGLYHFKDSSNNLSKELKAYHNTVELLINTFKNTLFSDEIFRMPIKTIQDALIASTSLIEGTAAELTSTIAKQESFILRTLYTQIAILCLTILLCLIFFFNKVIRNPIHKLKTAMKELASGNLSVRVPITSNDEIAETSSSFNAMAAGFESIIIEAGQITPHLANTSTNVFNATKQLENSISDQQIGVEKMRENVYAISLSLQEFIDSIVRANRTASTTSKLAGIGMFSLEEMETIMKQMDQGAKSILQTLSELSEKVSRINNVITSIVKIADQSNLLSLNTAIRAGKTGTKGLGVSVIAEKIRELADQIAYATLDIEDVVKEIVEGVSSTLTKVESFSSHIRQQVSEMTEISEKLRKLIRDTQEQIRLFEDINRGMQEQIEMTSSLHKQIHKFSDNTKDAFESVQTLYQQIEYLNFGANKLEKLTNSSISPHIPTQSFLPAQTQTSTPDPFHSI